MPVTHPDYLALLAAVCAAPDDDAPRLVLADWLDIDGPEACRDPARAEFIRRQIAGQEPLGELAFREYHTTRMTLGDPWRLQSLAEWNSGPVPEWVRQLGLPAGAGVIYWFKRGFPASVHITAADWLAHGDAILAAQPVTEVRLATWVGFVDGIGDPVPDATDDECTRSLRLRWPSVKTWHLPPAIPDRIFIDGQEARVGWQFLRGGRGAQTWPDPRLFIPRVPTD